jgi:hypothetical protein
LQLKHLSFHVPMSCDAVVNTLRSAWPVMTRRCAVCWKMMLKVPVYEKIKCG